MAGANSQFVEEGRYKPDPLNDYFDFILSVYSAGKLAFFAQQPFFPATQPGGGLKCQLNVTKCQDKQRLRDYLFLINFILPSSA